MASMEVVFRNSTSKTSQTAKTGGKQGGKQALEGQTQGQNNEPSEGKFYVNKDEEVRHFHWRKLLLNKD
jgi:hypothetical protein